MRTKLGFREIALMRMVNQRLLGSSATPAEVVRNLGAVQAQDYYGSLWAIGQRILEADQAAVEAAIKDRSIVRSWPMRGTLHFVAGADFRWMLRLLAPPVLKRHAARIQRELELDAKSIASARKVVVGELEGGQALTRPALYQSLEKAGIYAGGSRGIHIFWWLAQEGVICYALHAGRQPTFALLDEWLPPSRRLEADEALAELALRYFTGHGPATLQDLTWWSGLAAGTARQAWELVKDQLEELVVEERTYWHAGLTGPVPKIKGSRIDLLPAYDEFAVGYGDRSAIMTGLGPEVGKGGVIFHPVVLGNGQVVASWKSTDRKGLAHVQIQPFAGAGAVGPRALDAALYRYSKFLGRPVVRET